MSSLHTWAQRWGVSAVALAELAAALGAGAAAASEPGLSEAAVQVQVRLEASRRGIRLWRNNVGGMYDETGRFVRYGLANESAGMNKVIKSADLIGVRPVVITASHVGSTIGQFCSREIKAAGWRYTGNDREKAQLAWAQLIAAMGGDSGFASGVGTL